MAVQPHAPLRAGLGNWSVVDLVSYYAIVDIVTAMSAPLSPPVPVPGRRGDEMGTPATTDPRPQRGSITSLLILSLLFFMMSNHGGSDDFTVRNQYKNTLSSLEWQLGNYSAWLNHSDTTNFTMVRIHTCLLLCSANNSLLNSLLGHLASIVLSPKLYPTLAFSTLSLSHTILISPGSSEGMPPSEISVLN